MSISLRSFELDAEKAVIFVLINVGLRLRHKLCNVQLFVERHSPCAVIKHLFKVYGIFVAAFYVQHLKDDEPRTEVFCDVSPATKSGWLSLRAIC